ncbi:hypothetical protein SAMN02983003_1048 [Devosia enhydra]|uniref:Cell pole-organizing protein PopZ n=1 Tax=Devosia enhydra TaxID=665118 RepID=A0A1K2HV06_9HYPH|nr:DUF2497 domain-containing protein [Devosia enhydra]SFZ82387.1 hypothetical protein SAMN02983003_1048 [Devosia enhydra]
MNKPAAKEPSMDEILSSIRQIIADDDAATGRAATPGGKPAPVAAAEPPKLTPRPAPAKAEDDDKPLALKPSQIVADDVSARPRSFAELIQDPQAAEAAPEFAVPAELIDPDDITFVGEEPSAAGAANEARAAVAAPLQPAAKPEPRPAPLSSARAEPRMETPRMDPRPSPLPDPTLSADIAEELLEPATKAAVRSTFARLNGLSAVAPGITLEDLIRDMMRPMLKEWLDENLPAVVERMVEKEIERVSRGVD